MTLEQTIITVLVLFGLFLMGYSAISKKSLTEIFKEILEIFKTEI